MTTEPEDVAELDDYGDVSPDLLLVKFQGRSLIPLTIFSVVVHAVVLIGTSVPYFVSEVLRKNTAGMSDKEKMEIATREATEALREIAREHGLNPQDLSDKFTTRPSSPATGPKVPTPVEPEKPAEPEREKSDYEKDLETKSDGPAVPSVEEDLFK